ncbi:small integral membrane protein 11 isoform B [Patagioenas fasciata monilis]|uniref:Small integral membrane protein 11 isoform B n=1 Tax=Patagioenas fasciata monilis TaxID=372326 RepID=A0A1V4J2N9_PATFA|nr:small integral membrane protein 11 isoform B [Patagioenas fasciata monilis]
MEAGEAAGPGDPPRARGITNIFISASSDASALVCAFRSVTLISAGHSLLQAGQHYYAAKMVAFNWKHLLQQKCTREKELKKN